MPHINLEYSANVLPLPEFTKLFSHMHVILNEVGGIHLDNCKSRARVADAFLVGNGDRVNAFVHLDVRFIEGRSIEVKKTIGETLLDLLKVTFHEAARSLELQITVEVGDILSNSYFKYPEGTLTQQHF